jgi:hypothetical protein
MLHDSLLSSSAGDTAAELKCRGLCVLAVHVLQGRVHVARALGRLLLLCLPPHPHSVYIF